MAREVDIQLVEYRPIRDWKPCIGDVIIRHGWIQRTKWFAVVNFISPNGSLDIIKDGMIRLLVSTTPDSIQRKSMKINPEQIRDAVPGSYAVMQHDTTTNRAMWYV
ncbi:MAG: hypothetical protein QF535_15265 [Anaerolineales bacterium]|jgi:hypothetical protein|nr:hypothetical protein [Anaerolineales bacterium]